MSSIKKGVIALAAAVVAPMIFATESADHIVVTMRDGSQSEFVVSEIGKIWFSPTEVVVAGNNGAEVCFSRTGIKTIAYGRADNDAPKPSALTELTVAGTLWLNGDILHFPKDAAGLQVMVFGASGGEMVMEATTLSDDASLNILNLNKGIYLALLSDGRHFKFARP